MIADLKPYPEYKESGLPWLGQVPQHWEIRRLKQIARLAYGDSLPRTERAEGAVPVFGSNGRVGWHSDTNTQAPCIIVGRKGSFGKVNFCKDAAFVIDTAFFIDRRISAEDIRWLYYTLGWIRLDGVSKDAAIPGLDREDAYQQVAALPPPDEQAAIVRFLDWANGRLERTIRAKRKVIALLNEQKQAIIHRSVTRGIDPSVPLKPSGIPWLGDIPEHWEVRRLKQVCAAIVDCKNRTPEMVDGGSFTVVRTTNIRHGGFKLLGSYSTDRRNYEIWTQRGAPRVGDVFFTREAPVGEACLVPDLDGLCMGQRMMYFRPKASVLDPSFLLHSIYGPVVRKYIEVEANGSTVGHLRLGQVTALPLLWCPVDEQKKIVAHIAIESAPLNSTISRFEREIEHLREYRTRLVADVVTGKLDVREAAAQLPEEAPPEIAEDDGDLGIDPDAADEEDVA